DEGGGGGDRAARQGALPAAQGRAHRPRARAGDEGASAAHRPRPGARAPRRVISSARAVEEAIMDAGGSSPRNVLGGPLAECCRKPMTGFYRTGSCETGPEDVGLHVVCAEMTERFLAFSRAR